MAHPVDLVAALDDLGWVGREGFLFVVRGFSLERSAGARAHARAKAPLPLLLPPASIHTSRPAHASVHVHRSSSRDEDHSPLHNPSLSHLLSKQVGRRRLQPRRHDGGDDGALLGGAPIPGAGRGEGAGEGFDDGGHREREEGRVGVLFFALGNRGVGQGEASGPASDVVCTRAPMAPSRWAGERDTGGRQAPTDAEGARRRARDWGGDFFLAWRLAAGGGSGEREGGVCFTLW